MRYFIFYDTIARTNKRFTNPIEAYEAASKQMKIYLKLNSKVKIKEVDKNYYIFIENEVIK